MPAALFAHETAGFLLAGGQSSRMGSDKALVQLNGRPLIAIALEKLQSLRPGVVEPQIAGDRSPLHAFAPVIADQRPGHGPLSGIHAALHASRSRWNLFLPVDMPLVPATLLEYLLQRASLTEAPVTALTLHGHLQPFPAVLDRAVLAAIEQRLAAGRLACHSAWQSIPLELGSRLDAPSVELLRTLGLCSHPRGLAPHLWLQSANTPADLARMRNLL